jgi:phosphatidylethanolamine-binding protein (PEBP) family uncharacterized protein
LLCGDPDAPGRTFTHWVVTNISPNSTGVAENALPEDATVDEVHAALDGHTIARGTLVGLFGR